MVKITGSGKISIELDEGCDGSIICHYKKALIRLLSIADTSRLDDDTLHCCTDLLDQLILNEDQIRQALDHSRMEGSQVRSTS